MRTTEDIGNFQIYLPDENSKQFYIFCDLAELFADEYQSDSVSKLRKGLKIIDLKPKPSIDYEADKTSIRTSNFKTIIEVAKLIHKNSIDTSKKTLDTKDWDEIEERLKNWKRPKPQEWKENDIFSFKLKDSSLAFGQVLTKGKYNKTFALFDLKFETERIDLKQLKKSKPLTILHLMGMKLNDKSWKVIGHLDSKLANPDKGPWGKNYGKTGSDNHLESVANYYWFGECKWKNENDLKELIIRKNGLINKIKNWW